MARGDAEVRNKRKTKFRENKKHPYHQGGGKRTMNISIDNSRIRDSSVNESNSVEKGKKKGKN
jgi:hypothetical protein